MVNKEHNVAQEVEYAVDTPSKDPDTTSPLIMPASLAALSDIELEKVKRRATLKLDARIMPCMVLMYIMNYLDRQNIAAAKLADIEKDLKMTDVQYQTCVSILFVGYSAS
jgi:hypothetical protein